MKQFLKSPFIVLALFVGVVSATLIAAPTTQAIDVFSGACPSSGGAAPAPAGGAPTGGLCGAAQQDSAPALIQNVINLLLYLIGIIAVVVIIIGGIRYATSNGDSSAIKSAKDTILYAVVGLVVAILAYAIVNFVVAAF